MILSRFGDVILNLSSKKAVTPKGVSKFRNFSPSGEFFIYKYLQIAPLLIIFVDILPIVSAVHFAEFFHK